MRLFKTLITTALISFVAHAANHTKADVMTYLILKNPSAKYVDCREKIIKFRNIIGCTYELAGYTKKPLFIYEQDKYQAINGHAISIVNGVNYNDIVTYKKHDIDITKTLNILFK